MQSEDIYLGETAMLEFDPSQDYLEKEIHPLSSFFEPKSVAIIGAKEEIGSVGRTVLTNMRAHFKGKIFPVNPKYSSVLGMRAYPRAQDLPEIVDLAMIVTPSKIIPDLIDDCVARGIRSVVIISAGFKEIGRDGVKLEEEVLRRAKKGNIRIIGPNCLGIMNPHVGLNATFAAGMGLQGRLAFLSQSGALCTAVLDWSLQENVGFSAFASIGSMADIGWGDLIDYFATEPNTKAILMYMESVGNARHFLSAAKAAAFHKPIILIKPGRTLAAAKAAASHTGSLAGADDIFDAAIRRVGILRVETINELFNMAEVLSSQPRPKGPNLALITNAGGPAVLATDATLLNGSFMAELQPSTIEELSSFLPASWSHSNPVDILGDAGSERYAKTLQVVLKDPGVDGLLVILTPQDMTESAKTAELLHIRDKPILTSWMGASHVQEGINILHKRGIPTFPYPDSAARTFSLMWKLSDHLQLLYQTPTLRDTPEEGGVKIDEAIKQELDSIVKTGRLILTEEESKKILATYGIPVVTTIVAKTAEEAVCEAIRLGFPVVLKLHSLTITHKTDVGGVKLNLQNDADVKKAFHEIEKGVPHADFQGVSVQKMVKLRGGYEVIVGSLVDPQFGPVVLFGTGGELVEIYADKAIGIPPLNATLANRMMQRTKIYKALQGTRGKKSVDMGKLEEIVIRFSRMIVQQRRIAECDINPLIVSPEGMIALDARIVLHPATISNEDLPKSAIRPYPIEYISHMILKNGKKACLRPMRPEDEPLMIAFHKELSEETVKQRYIAPVALEYRIAHERLIEFCHTDYDREIVLIAEVDGCIVAVLRIQMGIKRGELKLVVIDRMQRLGLGTQLLEKSLAIAKREEVDMVKAHILDENTGMLQLCDRFGFKQEKSKKHHNIIVATLLLRGSAP